jgi:hypothetical protein
VGALTLAPDKCAQVTKAFFFNCCKLHIKSKRKQLNLNAKKINWLRGRISTLSTESKLLLYKAVLKPIWTYGIQLWATASNSNIEFLQIFQSKTLRSILNGPWYINNHGIHEDLQMNTVLSEKKVEYQILKIVRKPH